MTRTLVLPVLLAVATGLGGCRDAAALPAENSSGLPGLEPGGDITFAGAGSQLAQAGGITPVVGVGPENTGVGCRTDIAGDRIGARARSLLAGQKHECRVFQYWDFDVAARTNARAQRINPAAVLQSQISGTINLRGFLFVMGYGRASVAVDVTLFDLVDPANPKPIYSQNIVSYQLDPTIGLQGGLELGAEGGAPYIGISGGFQVSFLMPIEVKPVREEITFGFQSLLRRGSTYRVQVDLRTVARQSLVVGLPALSFFMGGRGDPDNKLSQVDPTADSENAELGDFLNPDYWMDGVNTLIDSRLSNFTPSGLKAFAGSTPRFYFPEVTVDLFGTSTTWGDKYVSLEHFPGELLPNLPDVQAVIDRFDDLTFPRTLEQLIRTRLATRGQLAAGDR
jgi:hypothetical protein